MKWGERTVLRAALYAVLVVAGGLFLRGPMDSPGWPATIVAAAVALAGLAASARPPD